ncbi:hypothetical protein JTE90_023011 [Oedothorax gibbosus]|uniref:Uncharacterized protein n=1 Tax=Oedothorax gibbosus TaxID=931172 RepID=A0AAV6U9R3_9ARAC|nr:hypothetical protein JTE90_023011 [Oedothorax gibbosus]
MTQGRLPKSPKPWGNHDCSQAEKQKKRAWGIFRRCPTEANLIGFERAQSHALGYDVKAKGHLGSNTSIPSVVT